MEKLAAYRDRKRFDIPETAKAIVLSGTGLENLAYTDVPVPKPGPEQLLCRVDAAGVCTSILKIIAQGSGHAFINGWDLERFPIILGDEGSVTVVEVGANLRQQYEPGQRFAIQPAVDVSPINHRERYRDNARNMSKCAVGYTLGGNLAQYILIQEEVLQGKCLVPLPDNLLGYFAVSMAEPVSCVYAAQQRNYHYHKQQPLAPRTLVPGLLKNGTTVVIGAGIMGRMHAEMAMRFRPRNLIISDILADRLEKARRTLGDKASHFQIKLIAVHADALEKTVNDVTQGAGADDVILAVGIQSVQQRALKLLGRGAVANLFGGLRRGQETLNVSAIDIHYNEVKLVGSSGGDPADLKAALEAIAQKDIDPGNYVCAVGGLKHAPEVLELMRKNEIDGRAILYPHTDIEKLLFVDYWNKDKESEFLIQNLVAPGREAG